MGAWILQGLGGSGGRGGKSGNVTVLTMFEGKGWRHGWGFWGVGGGVRPWLGLGLGLVLLGGCFKGLVWRVDWDCCLDGNRGWVEGG